MANLLGTVSQPVANIRTIINKMEIYFFVLLLHYIYNIHVGYNKSMVYGHGAFGGIGFPLLPDTCTLLLGSG